MIIKKCGRYTKKQRRAKKIKRFIKEVLIPLLIAFLIVFIMNELGAKKCYGDIEGDPNAKCYPLLQFRNIK